MGHGKSLGSFDGPPIFLYVHGWATKQKPMSTSKNKDNNKSKTKLSKLSNASDVNASVYTTTTSGRITANTTNWRAAQYPNW